MRIKRSAASARLTVMMAVAVALAACAAPMWAQDFIVQSRAGGLNFANYSEFGTVGNSGSQSSAEGLVLGVGSRIIYNQGAPPPADRGAIYSFTPTLTGDYDIFATWVTSTNGNPAFHHVITHDDTGSGATTEIDMNESAGGNAWNLIGRFQLTAGLTYTVQQDNIHGSGVGRMEAIKWTRIEPCLNTPAVTVVGPLAAGQTFVIVTEVTGAVADVKAYKTDGVTATLISTGNNADLGGGRVSVEVAALAEGDQIVATQTIAGQEGCVGKIGKPVGGGPNPPVKITLGIREGTFEGLGVGDDGGTASGTETYEWVGASDIAGVGFNAAPVGKMVFPSNNWQTVTFAGPTMGGTDPVRLPTFTAAGDGILQGALGILEELAFTIATDPCGKRDIGHYVLYIDNIKSGDTVVEDFEAYAAGTEEVMFEKPKTIDFSGVLFSEPNVSVVDGTIGDASSKSLRVSFQFATSVESAWVRLNTLDAAGGRPNPLIDLTKPLTVRLLLAPAPQGGTLTVSTPADASVPAGNNAVFTTTPSGATGSVNYSWFKNGQAVGTNSSTLTLTNVLPEDNGSKIKVMACDSLGLAFSGEATLTVLPPAPITPGGAKALQDGRPVVLQEVVVTHIDPAGVGFWVQDKNRSSGIFVKTTGTPPSVNTLVTAIEGIVQTDAVTTEKYIEAGDAAFTSGAAYTAEPLQVVNKSVAGANATGGQGLPNDGLLATIWGTLTKSDIIPVRPVLYVDDGSGVPNDTADVLGVKVVADDFPPDVGKFVKVTGIVRLEKTAGGDVIRKLETRGFGDLVVEN